MRDEKNVDFEVLRQNTFTEIFNSYPILLDGYVNKLIENKVNFLILADEFTDDVIKLYKNYQEDDFKKIKKKRGIIKFYGKYFVMRFFRKNFSFIA